MGWDSGWEMGIVCYGWDLGLAMHACSQDPHKQARQTIIGAISKSHPGFPIAAARNSQTWEGAKQTKVCLCGVFFRAARLGSSRLRFTVRSFPFVARLGLWLVFWGHRVRK